MSQPQSNDEPFYILEPSTFRSMREAQELTDLLEHRLADQNLGAASVRPELVETFSEIVNNAAEHGMSPGGAHAHVRLMPHRRGRAFDTVVADSGPGLRATLERNQGLLPVDSDTKALELAVQELVSGTANPTRGIGLWLTLTEMRKPGRKLTIHSGSAVLTVYGQQEPEITETQHRQGTVVRFTIPA